MFRVINDFMHFFNAFRGNVFICAGLDLNRQATDWGLALRAASVNSPPSKNHNKK
jgi:hypothetical protein